jgi:mono/diheme cytochrome c family protein
LLVRNRRFAENAAAVMNAVEAGAWQRPPSERCRVSRLLLLMAAVIAIGAASARAQDRDTIEAGHQLYDTHCASCHGERMQNPGSSFDLRGLHPNERPRFEASLLNGKGTQMPSWRGTLSETEIEQLWAYVRENAYD